MINADDLNPFAKSVALEIYSVHPEWKELSKIDHFNGKNCLLIKLTPNDKNEKENAISIYVDDEVTVSFDQYHHHFDTFTSNRNWQGSFSAQTFIEDIINENVAIASWWKDGRVKMSKFLRKDEVDENLKFESFTRVRIRTWNGNLNKDIELQS